MIGKMRFDRIMGPILTSCRLNIQRIYLGKYEVDTVARFYPSVNNYCLQCWQLSSKEREILKPKLAIPHSLKNKSPFIPSWQFTYIEIRGYAKGKDKKKGEKGKKSIQINDDQLSEIIKVDSLRSQFQKPVDKLKEEYIKNISLRSTTGSIETLQINLDGKDYILQELAQVVRKNPKTVVINMAVFPQAIPAAIQALQKSGMNLNPQQDGTTLFIPIPKITKEHRENLSKNAKVLFLTCRDSIKDVQNKFVKTVKNNVSISKDAAHDAQDQIIGLAEQYIAAAETILEAKQAELTGN